MNSQLEHALVDYLVDRERSRYTIAGYLTDLRLFSRWFEQNNGEGLAVDNLTKIDCRLYKQYLQEQKASPATINRRLACLRTLGTALKASGHVNVNPVGPLRGVAQQKTAPKWLDRRQQAALIREVELFVVVARTEAARRQAIRDRAAVLLMLNTGLRVSEICALELGDLDLGERKGALVVRSGKGCKSRTVPINKTARSALKAWLELREGSGQKVFTGKRGDELTENGLQRRLSEIVRRANIEATCHSLRHTFAKNLIDAKISIEKVAALLGHSDLNTTRIYTIPSQNDLMQAVGALDY